MRIFRKKYVAVFIILAAVIVGGVLYWGKQKRKDDDFHFENMPGNRMPFTVTENMTAASGVTNVGVKEERFEVENLDVELEIEEVYITSEEVIAENAAVLKLSEESVAEARKELEQTLREAELAYRAGAIEYEQKKITAKYERESKKLDGEQAQAVYDETISGLQDSVDKAKEELAETNEDIAEYESYVNDDTYRSYFKVDEYQEIYDETLKALQDKIDEWGVSWPQVTGQGNGGGARSTILTGGISSNESKPGENSGGNNEASTLNTGYDRDSNKLFNADTESGGDSKKESDGDREEFGDDNKKDSDDDKEESGDGNKKDTDDDKKGSGEDNKKDADDDKKESNDDDKKDSDDKKTDPDRNETVSDNNPAITPAQKTGPGSDQIQVLSSMYKVLEKHLKNLDEAVSDYEDALVNASFELQTLRLKLPELENALTEAEKEYQSRILQAKLTYETSLANAESAESDYKAAMEQAETDIENLKDDWEDAKENLELFESSVGDGYYHASGSGTVLRTMVREGQSLMPESVIFLYSNPAEMTVTVSVDQANIAGVELEDSVYIQISEYGGFAGFVTEINPVAGSDSRTRVTYSVTVKLDGNRDEIPANESVTVVFGLDRETIQNMITGGNGGTAE